MLATLAEPARADDASRELSVSAGANLGMIWLPDISYLLDRTNGAKVTADGELQQLGGTLGISFRPAGPTKLTNSVFGQRPSFRFAGSYWATGKSSAQRTYDAPANAFVNIDGTNSAINFLSGKFTPEWRAEGGSVEFMIEGGASKGWSFAPQAGLAFTASHQDYNIDTLYSNGALRQFLRGNLDHIAGGLHLGMAIQTPEWSGWRLGATPAARLMAAHSRMTLKQDPYNDIGSLDSITVSETKTHFTATPSLTLSSAYRYKLLELSANVKGEYLYGMPYFDLPSASADKSKIGITDSAFGMSGEVRATVRF